MIASECIPANTLALMISGKVSRRERKRWLPHLDACLDCRTVLAGAASYVDEASANEKPRRVWDALGQMLQSPALASGLAILLVALFAVVMADPMAWFGSVNHVIEQISTSTATAPLFREGGTSYTENRWVSNQRGFGFGPTLDETQRGFRTGLYLVDLRVAIHEGQTHEALRTIDELERLVGPTDQLGSLRKAVETETTKESIETMTAGVEMDARDSLDGVYISFGVWAEAARLASAANELTFFEDKQFTDALRAFRERDISNPISATLTEIDDLASQGLDDANLSRLQRELRQLILLN